MTTKTRNDGKPRRRPSLGVPAGSPPPPSTKGLNADGLPGTAPSWHELVQPGPKAEKGNLREKHGPYRRDPLPGNANYAPREELRLQFRRQGRLGRLVLHSRKPVRDPQTAVRMAWYRLSAPERAYVARVDGMHPDLVIRDEAMEMAVDL